MTMTNADKAAQARAEHLRQLPGDRCRRELPSIGSPEGGRGERARVQAFASDMRAELVDRDGKKFYRVDGYASTTGRAYQMWDLFGEYQEKVAGGAFDTTLAAKPDVAFLLNHRGMTMARTTNGTLELAADSLGLRPTAWLNSERQDVRDMVSAIDDHLITEMSFAFTIDDAEWNDDYTEFTILQVDLDRGDVSAVNYGANPFTSIAVRSREMVQQARSIPADAARIVLSELQSRADLAPKPSPINLPGRSLDQLQAWIDTQV